LLLVWGLTEEFVNPSEPSIAVLLVPYIGMWLGAFGWHDDRIRGGLDLVMNRGVSLSQLFISRYLLALLVGLVLAAALFIPVLGSAPGSARIALGQVGVLTYWTALATIVGFWAHPAAVVMLASVSTAISLLWEYSVCLRLTGGLPTEWPWALLTWSLQLGGNILPAESLSVFGGHPSALWVAQSGGALLVLALGAWTLNRLSLPVGG